MTLAERRAQVNELRAKDRQLNADSAEGNRITEGRSANLRKVSGQRQKVRGGYITFDAPPADALPPGQRRSTPPATLAAIPTAPTNFTWQGSFPIVIYGAWWGVAWDNEPDIAAVHLTLYRAADGFVMYESCRSGPDGYAHRSWRFDGDGTDPDWGPQAGERYYAKIAVSRSTSPGNVSTNDWTCGTGWSAEATTPTWAARGEGPLLAGAETKGCWCDGTSGRPAFQNFRGDPVNTATGALTEVFTDAVVPAPGVDLRITRTYASSNTIQYLIGPRWTLSYPGWLSFSTGWATYKSEDGSVVYFEDEGNGVWSTYSMGARVTLAGTPTAGYTMTTADQQKLTFDGAGWLTSWKDRSGKGLTFTYVNSKLVTITDGAGRNTSFTHDTTTNLLTKITLPDGRWIGYTYTAGKLTGVRDVNGGTTAYTYDSSSRMTSITDPRGKLVMQSKYDSSGRVIEQTDASGTVIKPVWDASESHFPDAKGGIWTDVYAGSVRIKEIDPYGKVTSYRYDFESPILRPLAITDPNGNVTTMTYDARGNMLTRAAPASVGITETWTYDSANNVTSYTDGRGKQSTFTYDAAQRLATETDPLAGKTSYTYTAAGDVATVTSPAGRITRYGYDTAGNQTSVISPGGGKTTNTYDSTGRMLTRTDPRGNVTGADPARYTTRYTYDAAGNVVTITDPSSRVTTYGYDANGNRTSVTDPATAVTRYTYDAANRLTAVTDPAGHTRTTGYDPAGNVTSVTDAVGGKTTYGYDAAGRLTSTVGLRGNASGGDPATDTISYGYDAAGNQTSITDQTGALTQTAFDANNRPTTVTDPLGRITRYSYDKASNQTTVTDPTGAVTTRQFDARGWLTGVTDPLTHTTTYGYDADGLRTQQTSPLGDRTTWGYDADGLLTSTVEPRGNASGATPADFTTKAEYDAAGNRTKLTDPLGRSVASEYDADNRLSKSVDPNGRGTTYTYDASGRITSVVTPTGATTRFAYDTVGNLRTVTTPLGKGYGYSYDAADRVTTATTPTGGTTGYTYRPDSSVATVTLPVGSISYAYDNAGRTTGVDYSDSTPDLAYTYDRAGQTTTASNGTSTAAYGYDTAGRITSVTRGGRTFGYAWNKDGQLTRRTLPDGRVQNYAWQADSRLASTTLTSGATNRQVGYGYDAAGNRTSVTRQGGPSSSYTYDRAGSLTRVAHTSGSTTLVAQDVIRTATGAPGSVTTTRGTTTTRAVYSYDAADQVTGVCRPASGTNCAATDPKTTYGYDLNGNRTSKVTANTGGAGTSTYTYDADDRPTGRTVNGAATTVAYTANGTLGSETGPAGTTSYTYGLDANLRQARLPSGALVDYEYDEDGNRIRRTVNSATDATWTWDTLGLPTRVEENNGAGTVTHRWWDEPQGQLGTALADTVGANPSWLLDDYQGSLTDLANATTLTGSASFDPFGEMVTSTGGYAANPLRFHGQYLDDKIGLYDVRARDYDAASGRFTAPDPVPAADGSPFVQTYHYGNNRPTVLTDPTGQCAIVCTAIIGAVVGAAAGGVDCWLSGDDRNTCIKKVAVGAAAGALTGATMGMAGGAGAGLYGGVTAGEVGTTALVGGTGSALYGSGVAAWTGQPYGYGDAAQDFMWGAAFAGAGGTASALAGRSGAQAFPCPPPGGTAGTPNLPWTSWNNYTKMTAANGQEYALIGGRLYSRHAVDRMQPSWLRFNARPGPDEGGSVGGMPQLRQTGGSYDYGRGVSPNWVEYVIRNSPGVPQDNGNLSHVLGTLQVIVSPEGRVVTVITH
ncbi:RHS repeat-associated core domain-containing protein [Micromonospora sp. NPDC005215]|uniref:RHS repeat-associated core domain-containing protein n=1 Tax=Micromonospora sp. NPDC005215 TaxID=3157024 RepID=UPI0033A7C06A